MQRVNIVIASPNDVTAERDAVQRVFNRWNSANDQPFLHPVMWEHAAVPELGAPPQHLLNPRLVDKGDLLVAVLWSKLGTPTATARSGTVEEIREFVALKGPRRVMLSFCTRDIPYDTDPAELARLHEFKAEMRPQGLYQEYRSVQEFEGDLYRHLDIKIHELTTGLLPLPRLTEEDRRDRTSSLQPHADPRLREPIDFGTSLPDIASGFCCTYGAIRSCGRSGPGTST